MSSAFACERSADGVLVITLDVPGEKVNTLGGARIAEFEKLLDEVERDAAVRAVVIRSGKPDNFIAGADINDFMRIRSAEEGEALSRAATRSSGGSRQRLPVVAAIHGAASAAGSSSRSRAATAWPRTSRRRRSGCPR
jgi:3-hydroxyacyl-CoA dehydrogenase/enoyl-CoA hydratase/3-hydroxybutyryl-CoA epimerase